MPYLLLFLVSVSLTVSYPANAGKPELNKRHYPSADIQNMIVEAELNSITGSTLDQASSDTGCKDVNIGNADEKDPFKSGGFGDTNIEVTNVTVYNICR